MANMQKVMELLVMVAAALLEVGGDALIRKGLRGGGIALVILGFVVLGSYGILLNRLPIDFGRLLGAYVGVFALISILFGSLVFHESIGLLTWIGVAVVLIGSLIIQFAVSRS
jgi:small multidrug resistance family-3 protein